jgi:hypothetical protein
LVFKLPYFFGAAGFAAAGAAAGLAAAGAAAVGAAETGLGVMPIFFKTRSEIAASVG